MAPPESGTIAILAEKPSVARDIARVLGATSKGDGYLHGNGYVVAWAIGHLVALAQPHEMNPEWRYWRRDLLPMLPKHWPLVVYQKTKDQFEVVRKILRSPGFRAWSAPPTPFWRSLTLPAYEVIHGLLSRIQGASLAGQGHAGTSAGAPA